MKRFNFILLLAFLLAACQTAPATSIPTPSTPIAATPTHATVSKSTSIPTLRPTPTGPAVHSSSSNPNAVNFIAVKDQPIINNSITIDTVTSAQAGFIVLYYDKEKEGRHSLGGIIMFAPIPAGKSNQLVLPLSQNLNPSVNLAALANNQVDAVLQTDASKPNSMVQVKGVGGVWVTFTILSSGKGKTSIFTTATP